jgi:hypothetical protein
MYEAKDGAWVDFDAIAEARQEGAREERERLHHLLVAHGWTGAALDFRPTPSPKKPLEHQAPSAFDDSFAASIVHNELVDAINELRGKESREMACLHGKRIATTSDLNHYADDPERASCRRRGDCDCDCPVCSVICWDSKCVSTAPAERKQT